MSQLVYLAPLGTKPAFGKHVEDGAYYSHLLEQACCLRGQLYLGDGAISEKELDDKKAFHLPIDDVSWHILLLSGQSNVMAAVRLTEVPFNIRQRRGKIPHIRSSLARSEDLVARLWEAERFLAHSAVSEGSSRPNFFVVGGWASRESQGAEVALAAWALTRRSNCAAGLAIASERHDAFRLLIRTGAKPIYPPNRESLYFDPHYGCKVALLGFRVFDESVRVKRIVSRMADGLDASLIVMAQ